MTQPAHLSDEQMTRYRNREMTGVELLDLDSHLSTCADCRERLYKAGRSSAGMKELRSEFSEHLQYADIVACSEGSGKPLHVAHIRECAGCRAEVQDLSRFRTELADTPRRPVAMPKKPWVRYRIPLGIAAAGVVVAGGVTFALRRGGTPPAPAPATVEQAEASIPAPDREIFERAIASGRLDRAPILEGLVSRRGTLLGGPEGKRTIELLTPVGTAVLGDRPFLRWSGLETASSYVVAVFDEKFQKVAESPAIEGT